MLKIKDTCEHVHVLFHTWDLVFPLCDNKLLTILPMFVACGLVKEVTMHRFVCAYMSYMFYLYMSIPVFVMIYLNQQSHNEQQTL